MFVFNMDLSIYVGFLFIHLHLIAYVFIANIYSFK